jgi:type I restriction enzyme S subunit
VKLQNVKKAMLQKMFPARGSTTPQIRFAGFTEPWEECALADALSLLKDGTHGTHSNVGDGYYLLRAKNIKNGSVFIDSATDRMISEDEFKKIHWNFQLKKGDVLLTIVGSIGESAIIDNPEKITFQRSVAYLRPNNRTTSEFLLSTIASSQFQDELQNRQVVSAQPGIYLGVLGAITVQFPKIAEQIKIGAYFKHLDTRISLQQRKLEKLQNVKKACLAAMFV